MRTSSPGRDDADDFLFIVLSSIHVRNDQQHDTLDNAYRIPSLLTRLIDPVLEEKLHPDNLRP
jgi:hypothetical protein